MPVKKKSKKSYHHGDLREAVLALGLTWLEKRPNEELTLRELSRQLGVSPMALYRHFADRDALINDAAMQALGSYKGGRMLFLGLGTGLGSAMIVDGVLQPMELAHLIYKNGKPTKTTLACTG